MGQLGFFDADKRLEALSAKGDPLEAIDRLVPWESFRAEVEAVVLTSDELKKSSAGRKPFDALLMFRMLVLQALNNLSDEQVEYQVELHGEGRIVNHKKVMRLMKENGLSVRPRRRFIATTDSDHDGPIFPNLAKNIVPTNLNQLWVADITYIAIATGFVYLAAILDAWSRRVVGYAIGKRIDARL